MPKYVWVGAATILLFWCILLIDTSKPTGLVVSGYVESSATVPGNRTIVEDRMAVIKLENGVTLYLKDNRLRPGDKLKFRKYKSMILGKITYKRSL